MLPTSHPAPINLATTGGLGSSANLAGAFAEFNAAASRLEHSYQELQKEVVQLRAILAERTQALQASHAENSQMKLVLRQILDSLPCGVLVMDEGQRVSLSNPEARRLLEVRVETLTALDDVPEPGLTPLQSILQTASQSDADAEFCISGSASSGAASPRWLAVRSCQLDATVGGSRRGQTIVILRDTTPQKKLEEERESARNSVALAEMSVVLAHEIRNPLASLELFAGLIVDRGDDPAPYVAQLRAGIRSLAATVNNVLRFHSGGTLQRARVPLLESLRNAVEFARPLADQRGIDLSLQAEPGEMFIGGDHNALQQVFLNLALNAFRHTDKGGWLRVSASQIQSAGGECARVAFSDNGCGIDPQTLPHIFSAGWSGSGQTPGLGLAVCRRIVEQHEGTLKVSSEPGRGTTFSMEFPILL
ncbi:MAG TPA: ATP-binding protein [Candidatus Angelobacter sp.]|nr:ATP-binding protein [Candidatus Angelobacter sp.]